MIGGERGVPQLLLSLVLVLVSCIPSTSTPTPAPAAGATGDFAREVSSSLVRVAAYDYALAGFFAGDTRRIVTPDRYVIALAAATRTLIAFKDKVTAHVFADARDATALVRLADAVADLADALTRFTATRDADAFAAVTAALDATWPALRSLATGLPAPDPEVQRALSRGPSWSVRATRGSAFAVITAPLGARAGVYGDREAAQRRVNELRDAGIVGAIAEEERFTFARSGSDPVEELWREPALDLPVPERTRRLAFVAGGVLAAQEEGGLRIFDEQGRLRWSGRTAAGTVLVAPSPDGRLVAVGGVQVGLLSAQGASVGAAARLASPASAVAWTDAAVVIGSAGSTGKPEGGAGTVVALSREGRALEDPFPLVTPAGGALLAATGGEVYVATTTRGATDVEVLRPGASAAPRAVARVPGQQQALALRSDASRGALVTAEGTFRFAPGVSGAERLGDPARDVRFGADGTLYVLWPDRLVAYDDGLRPRWSASLADGRRLLVGQRVVALDGATRVRALDPRTGMTDDLAIPGQVLDLALSADGARLLVLVDGRRAVAFALP